MPRRVSARSRSRALRARRGGTDHQRRRLL